MNNKCLFTLTDQIFPDAVLLGHEGLLSLPPDLDQEIGKTFYLVVKLKTGHCWWGVGTWMSETQISQELTLPFASCWWTWTALNKNIVLFFFLLTKATTRVTRVVLLDEMAVLAHLWCETYESDRKWFCVTLVFERVQEAPTWLSKCSVPAENTSQPVPPYWGLQLPSIDLLVFFSVPSAVCAAESRPVAPSVTSPPSSKYTHTCLSLSHTHTHTHTHPAEWRLPHLRVAPVGPLHSSKCTLPHTHTQTHTTNSYRHTHTHTHTCLGQPTESQGCTSYWPTDHLGLQ